MSNPFSSFLAPKRQESSSSSNQNDSINQQQQAIKHRQNSLSRGNQTQKSGGLLDQYSNQANIQNNINTPQVNSSNLNLSQSQSSSNMESFNRYITKMIPNKAQKVVDNVMEKYERIKDIIEKNIKPNRFSLSDEEIQKLTISLSDFDQYKNNIETEYKEYQHQKKQNGSFEDHLHDMHLNKNLVNCYLKVPQIFFADYENEEYPFLNDIGRDVRALLKYQNQIVEYLDEVELNLFYQVYFRFNQILEMILDFDKMGKTCEENIVKVRLVKNMNANMKQTLIVGGLDIIKKKKSQERMKRTYELLLKLKSFEQNKELILAEDPQLQQLIFNDAKQLQGSSSSQLSIENNEQKSITSDPKKKRQDQTDAKLKSIKLYNMIQKKYVQVFKREEQDHYSELLDGASKYLKENLNFKEQQKKISHVEHSIDISSIHSYNSNLHNDSSSIHYDQEDDIDENLQVFEWTSNDILPSNSVESHISKLYLKSSHNFDLMRFEVFKNNITKDVQKFQVTIRNQFREYCIQLYRSHNYHEHKEFKQEHDDEHAFLNDINDILLMKFAQFYSTIIQSYLKKSFSLLNTMKKDIINSSYQTDQSVNYWQSNVMPIVCNLTSFQIELLDLFSSDLIAYLKYINTSTDANLPFKITTSNQLFSYWLVQFPVLFRSTTELNFSECPSLPSQIQAELNKANKDTIQTYDQTYFYKQKSDLHFELFITFDEKQKMILENSLSNDNWNPCNISYKIYSLLDYFFIVKKKQDFTNNSDDEEEQFNKIRSNIIKADSDEEEEEEDLQDLNHYYIKKFDRDYKIQLNKLIFEKENKRYMFSEGFLTFLRQVQKYIGIMSESKIEYSKEYLERLISLIRFYNSFSREFIFMAKGKNANYPQMGNKVTVKNLATSSLNLTFLLKIFDKIGERLVQYSGVSPQIIQVELDTLKVEIQNHISEIFGTIPNIIKDMLQKCSAQVNLLGWHKPQEKINVPLAQTARIIDSIRSMHNVLDEIINNSEMKYIFEIILNDFIETYVYSFNQLLSSPDSNRWSVQRINDEVTYFANELLDIPIIQQLPNLNIFSNSLSPIIQISKVPRLEDILNKQNQSDEEEDEEFQNKKQAFEEDNLFKQKGEEEKEDQIMQKIVQKYSSIQENQEDQDSNNNTMKISENAKIGSHVNLSNTQDTTINSNNHDQIEHSQDENQTEIKK